ncbi:MAG: histidinol dehydrogenase, partial [Pseudomonadota bacterium]
MVRILKSTAPDFGEAFAKLLTLKRESSSDVSAIVTGIINDIRAEGDEALIRYTEKFDRFSVEENGLNVSEEEVEAAWKASTPEALAALEGAATRIEAYHQKQMPQDERYTDAQGVELGWRWTPIDAVGLYVPGGLAAYPSSVLMNAIPARVAGARRLVMVVPTPEGHVNPLVLAAAKLAGISEIYRIGGAQAVAALAYGTQTIQPVDKIVGPGNA